MQAINPINLHTKFGKDRINTFPSNEWKPSIRMPEKAKLICPPPSGVDIITAIFHVWASSLALFTPKVQQKLLQLRKIASEMPVPHSLGL